MGEMHQGEKVVDVGLHLWAAGGSGQVVQDNPHRKKICLEHNYLETIIQQPPKPHHPRWTVFFGETNSPDALWVYPWPFHNRLSEIRGAVNAQSFRIKRLQEPLR